MNVHGDVLRCRKHCPGAPGPAQLAHTVCRKNCVPLSQCRGPTRVTPDLVPHLSSLKKEVWLVGGLSGGAGRRQGVRSRSWTDTGHTAFAGGHAVKVTAGCLLAAHLLVIGAPGTAVAPALRTRLGFLWETRIKGRMLKHTVH